MIEKPKVGIANVGFKDTSAKGATVVFAVNVDNPNPFPIRVDTVRYAVELSGRAFTSGQLDKGLVVPSKAAAVLEVPITVLYTDLYSSLFEFINKGSSRYRIHGDASLGWLSVPFDESGDLKLKP